VCEALAKKYPLRLISRKKPTNGLSGAVLHGMAEARGEVLCVMDADLQHPPEKLPELIAPIERGNADFVMGSRYMHGGSIETGWTWYRAINSQIATLLARPFAGRMSDPMSGFFALRRDDYAQARHLTPLGYKIGLELLSKTRVRRVHEIPIHFGKRLAGESKLSLKEQFRYLEHLSRLYDFSFPRLSPMVKFAIVTILSWSVAAAAFVAFRQAGVDAVVAVTLAYGLVIAVTAVFHARYVRTQREFLVHQRPWGDFLLAACAEWIVCAMVVAYLLRRAEVPHETEAFVLAFAAALAARYVLRKELLLDVRGLRHELRKEEMLP
jgi:dolichol-phosphate mannosyltransferase